MTPTAVPPTGQVLALWRRLDRLHRLLDLPLGRACVWGTPTVTMLEGRYIAERTEPPWRRRLLKEALAWLTTRLPGAVALRIRGRPYTAVESQAIWADTAAAADLPCPFKTAGGCLLRPQPFQCRAGVEAGPSLQQVGRVVNLAPQAWRLYGFLPTILAATWDPRAVAALVDEGQVADVKLALQRGRREHQLDKLAIHRQARAGLWTPPGRDEEADLSFRRLLLGSEQVGARASHPAEASLPGRERGGNDGRIPRLR